MSQLLETLGQDVRCALRSFRRSGGDVLATTATLALGIGAITAIFSILSGVLLRPLPYAKPDALLQLGQNNSSEGLGPVFTSDLRVWRERSSSFSEFSTWYVSSRNLLGTGEPERLQSVMAERNLFHLLGTEPLAGRTFRPDDPPNVVVISAALWSRRYRSDRSWLGRTILLDREPYVLIGVMPDRFQFPYRATPTELWLPWAIPANRGQNPNSRVEFAIGRLKSGVSTARAQAELMAISPRAVAVVPLVEFIGGKVRPALLTLFGAASLLWLAACANAANMLLARAAKRSHEIAVRMALGAGRTRLIRQLLAESVLLSAGAGLVGLALGIGGMRLLLRLAGSRIPRAWEIGFDWRVFGFLFAASILTGLAFGVLPAFNASQADPMKALKKALRLGGGGKSASRIRDGLVVAEVAVSFVLLVSAGLLLQAFLRLRNTPIGLHADNILTLRITHANADYTAPGSYGRYVQQLENRIGQIPGVRSAGFIQYLPLRNWGWFAGFSIEGRPQTPFDHPEHPKAELRYVSPGYFRTLGIPLLAGRYLTERDTPDTPMAILINEALANRYFAGEDPVGRKTDRGVIVGVVGNVRSAQVDRPATPEIYYAFAQNTAATSDAGVSLVVNSIPPPERLATAVRAAIHEVKSTQAIYGVSTMRDVIAESLADASAYVWLIGIFADLALLIAVSGIYGVVSLVVASRQREFAIRRALGANRFRIVRLVFSAAAGSVAAGLGLGAAGIWAVSKILNSLAPGIQPPGFTQIAATAAVLSAATLAAGAAPAALAIRMEPQSALKEE
jgi:predicted permease